MIYKNKKGDIMLDIVLLILLAIIYFNFYPAIDAMTSEMLNLNPDSLTGWMLRGTSFFILLGLLRFTLNISSNRGGQN